MRRRRKSDTDTDAAEVAMSPLIDCVFLLLIFFLVTTIIKRKEKQIQIEMPDNTSAVAEARKTELMVIGLDAAGSLLALEAGLAADGGYTWRPIGDLSAYLKNAVELKGAAILQDPLQINAHRMTPFQKAIDALDICKLQGFDRVYVKTRPEPTERD
jgi:biopolymer transport protein ExbD